MKAIILLYANCQGDQMHGLTARVQALREDFVLERIFLGSLGEFVQKHGRADAEARLRAVRVVWEQSSQASPEERVALRAMLPNAARWIRFPALTCSTLWPFGASDTRPGGGELYPYSDILAARLWREMGGSEGRLDDVSDDNIFERYMTLSAKMMPDLNRVLERDLLQWQQRDRDSDIAMTGFLAERLRGERLFYTVGRGSSRPTAEILRRLVSDTVEDASARNAAVAELDGLSQGYVGNDSISVPVHPLVAQRLGLSWYQTHALYRWSGHSWDLREWITRCVRLSDYN